MAFAGEFWLPESKSIMKENPALYNNGYVVSGRPYDWNGDNLYKNYEQEYGASRHMTIVFNCFVWLQIFNFVGSRRINDEKNIFEGLFSNAFFLAIWVAVAALQVLIIFVGNKAFKVSPYGLTGEQWGICIAFGAG